MQIRFSKQFTKSYEKSPDKIKDAFDQRLDLFKNDKFHPLLNNHALTGNYSGYRSINITGDWRVIFTEQDDVVYFEIIGTHSQLYR